MQTLVPTGTFMTNVLNRISTAKSDVSKIPDNTVGGSLTLDYVDEINLAPGTVSTITSTYVAILGNEATSASQVGATIAVLNEVNTFMSSIGTSSQTFVDSVATFKTSIDGVQTSIQDFSTTINDAVSTSSGVYDSAGPALDGITIGVSVYFGIVIGFCVLGILGCLLMTFCDKYKCRYLIYFACVVLFLIGIIGFLLAVVFSAITPAMYFGCEYIDFAISSPANFQTAFGNIIDQQTSEMITTCLPGQDGKLIDILAPDIADTLNGATDSITSISDFNSSSFVSLV